MSFSFGTEAYIRYLEGIAQVIADGKDYISALDAATGDGDHWANMNKGFQKLLEAKEELTALPLQDAFKKIGMILMSQIGGSSGVLYGSAYIAASKKLNELNAGALHRDNLGEVLAAMLKGIMDRGKAEPGNKTMIDALEPAVRFYQEEKEQALSDQELLAGTARAALDGAEATRAMSAFKGRAFYQQDKGVGHLDPGAVTMAYQIRELMACIMKQ